MSLNLHRSNMLVTPRKQRTNITDNVTNPPFFGCPTLKMWPSTLKDKYINPKMNFRQNMAIWMQPMHSIECWAVWGAWHISQLFFKRVWGLAKLRVDELVAHRVGVPKMTSENYDFQSFYGYGSLLSRIFCYFLHLHWITRQQNISAPCSPCGGLKRATIALAPYSGT